MKYLCLCYYDADAFAKLSPEEVANIAPACKPHDANLKATGKVEVIGSLAMPDQWTTFVPRNGKPQAASGAYLKDPNMAGAFFIIEAKDAEEARQVAAKHPAANFGENLGFAVEVRPCASYEKYS
jgi:hypothetical protein